MTGIAKGANFLQSEVPDGIERTPLSFVARDGAVSRGLLYRPPGRMPRVGVHVMHPKTDQTANYNILPLVKAGYAVLGRAGRWVNNDIGTIHEKVLLDVAEGVRHLGNAGCEQVILLGNSGGGPLATFYQSQALTAPPDRLTESPAGDPLDLNEADLPAADGIVLIGAHAGEGYSLRKWLDPSLTDESDVFAVDPALDMYSASHGFRVPPEPSRYDAGFLASLSEAREARARRLDAIARSRIDRRRSAAREARFLAERGYRGTVIQRLEREAAFPGHLVILRGQADPAWVDTSIEPDDRDVCSFSNDPRPDLVNYAPAHSPIVTPEAYLSTWSGISSRACTLDNVQRVTTPLLVVHYAGDSLTRLSEARAMVDNCAAADRSLVFVPRADHYGFTVTGPHKRGPRTAQGTDAVVDWLRKRFPI